MVLRPDGGLHWCMARAMTGGRVPVGWRRRTCRRLLPTLAVVIAFGSSPVLGASGSDAWMSVRQVHLSQSAAIGEGIKGLADGSTAYEVRELRQTVAAAIRALDAIEVHDCFRVWWSFIRSSYVLFDQALVGLQAKDLSRVQTATAGSRYLSAMAQATSVDCSRSDAIVVEDDRLGLGDRLLAVAVGVEPG